MPKPRDEGVEMAWFAALFVLLVGFPVLGFIPSAAAAPTRSTTIALTSDETRLVVVNREANTVSVIQRQRRRQQAGRDCRSASSRAA
jgi:DNA-binding beta-propeller fold protein YncE